MDLPLKLNFRETDNTLIIDLQGDLTKEAEDTLLHIRTWSEGLGGQLKYLVLNFTRTPYINSAGIAVLIRLSRAGLKGGYETFAFGVTPHYEKLFRMVGLTEYMMIYPNEYSVMERIAALG